MSRASVPDRDGALASLALALAGVGFLASAGTSWGGAAPCCRPSCDAPARLFVFFLLPSPHFLATPLPRALHDASNVHQLLSGVRNVWAVKWECVLGFADGTTLKRSLQTFVDRLVQAGSAHEVLAHAEHHVLTGPQADRAAERCVVISAIHGESLQET